MIVDCHTHFSADQRVMSEHIGASEPVDKCIVLGTPEPAVEDINEHLAEYVNSYKDKMIGFAFIDPTSEVYTARKLRSCYGKSGSLGNGCLLCRMRFSPCTQQGDAVL